MTRFRLVLVFVAILAAVGGAGWYTKQELRKAETEHDEVDRQFADAAKRIEQVRQMQDKQRKMAGQAELTASLLEKVPRSVLLAELTNAKPGGISFLDLMLDSKVKSSPGMSAGGGGGAKTQFEMKRAAQDAAAGGGKAAAPPAPQAKLYDVSVKVTGVADSDLLVAQFMAKLQKSKLVRDVNLIISEAFTFNDTKMRKFTIEMVVDPEAEVQPGGVLPKNATAAVPVTDAK
jgi:Tfp pilus assembly protein PilN